MGNGRLTARLIGSHNATQSQHSYESIHQPVQQHRIESDAPTGLQEQSFSQIYLAKKGLALNYLRLDLPFVIATSFEVFD